MPESPTNSIRTGLSLKQYSLREAIVEYSEAREGRFSWNRSPANKSISTSCSTANCKISRNVLIES